MCIQQLVRRVTGVMDPRNSCVLVAVALLGLVGCTDGFGPASQRVGGLAFRPLFVSGAAAGVVPVELVRLTITRADGVTVVADTVIDLAAGEDSIDLSVPVELEEENEEFLVEIKAIDALGDTVFRGGPISVMATTDATGEPAAVDVPLEYVGVGADAVAVRVATLGATVLTGDTVLLLGEALGVDGNVIEGTPIAWTSADTARATVPDRSVGAVVGGLVRGQAPIVAALLTGPTDTAGVLVQPTPSLIEVEGGDGQTAVAGSALSEALAVRVRAADELGVQGVVVLFTPDAGSVSSDSVVTDSAGIATVTWTLGVGAGQQAMTAGVAGVTGVEIGVTATALAGPADTAVASAGDGQTGVAGEAVAVPPAVLMQDANGNPVPGVGVTFAVVEGGGTITGSSQVTGNDGIATLGSWTLGTTAGTNRVEASLVAAGSAAVHALGSAPPAAVTFTATGTPGTVTELVVVSGDFQEGAVGAVLPEALAVVATDVHGNPVSGMTVGWAVAVGSGSLSATSTVTDAVGQASVTYTPGTPGAETVAASASGVASVEFGITALGAAAALAITQQPEFDPATGAYPTKVVVLDQQGNVVNADNATTVTLRIVPGTGTTGAALTGTNPVTVVSGVASFDDLDVTLAGTGYELEATSPGFTAVTSAPFDVNEPPVVAITSPASGTVFNPGDAITLGGGATDAEDGALAGTALVWRSDRDGVLGTGAPLVLPSGLSSQGVHVITLTATDLAGAAGVATIGLSVNTPPVVTIAAPLSGERFSPGDPVTFSGSATDAEDGLVPGGSLEWSSDVDGFLGTGTTIQRFDLSEGAHVITLGATDQDGFTGQRSAGILVSDFPFEFLIGPGLNQSDDDCDFRSLGFSFVFYGVSYDGVWVNSNGNLTFNACNRAWWRPDVPDGTNILIGPLYGDFNPRRLGDVHVNTLGAPPNRRFVATWSGVSEFSPGDAGSTFQVQLFEGSNNILFVYDQLNTDGINWSFSPPSTDGRMDVGITSGTGSFINSLSGSAILALAGGSILYVPSGSDYVEFRTIVPPPSNTFAAARADAIGTPDAGVEVGASLSSLPSGIERLLVAVETLPRTGLGASQTDELARKLELARELAARGSVKDAILQLMAFERDVQQLVEQGVLAAQGPRLLTVTRQVLGGGAPR